MACMQELVALMLHHIKKMPPPHSSYAGQLLKIQDAKTGAPI
jgi:hypothetical protein